PVDGIVEADVIEVDVFGGGVAQAAFDGVVGGVGIAAANEINLEEAAAEDVAIFKDHVVVEAGAADTGFDVDGLAGGGGGHFAVFDADVADAAGGFAADAD